MKQAFRARSIIIVFVFGLVVTLSISSFSYRKDIKHTSICPKATVQILDCTTGDKVIQIEQQVRAGWPVPIWSRTLDSAYPDLHFSWPFCIQGCVFNSTSNYTVNLNWLNLAIDLGTWLLVCGLIKLGFNLTKRS